MYSLKKKLKIICRTEQKDLQYLHIVGIFELYPMPSYLDANCCLIISNSIEINRLVCVIEKVPAKSRQSLVIV